MGPTERVVYALPIVMRRLLRRAEPELRRRAWEVIKASLAARLGDQRPLVGLYVCEALEVSLELIPPEERPELLRFAEAWSEHPVSATRLMAWRLLLGLAKDAQHDTELMTRVRERVEVLGDVSAGSTRWPSSTCCRR